MRKSMTANGELQTREDATVGNKDLDLFVKFMLLEETPASHSLGDSARIMGIPTIGPALENHNVPKKVKKMIAFFWDCVPLIVPDLSTSSSTTPTPTSSTSSSQDSENRRTERSGNTSEESRGNQLHRSTKPKTQMEMKDTKKYSAICCMTCLISCRISESIWSMNVVLQRPCADGSRHFQFFSWNTNGVGS